MREGHNIITPVKISQVDSIILYAHKNNIYFPCDWAAFTEPATLVVTLLRSLNVYPEHVMYHWYKTNAIHSRFLFGLLYGAEYEKTEKSHASVDEMLVHSSEPEQPINTVLL